MATVIRPGGAGWKAHAALRASGGTAHVVAPLADSLYLEAGGEILWLGGRGSLRHPRAVLAAGDLPRGHARLAIDLEGLEPWRPRRVQGADRAVLRAGARDLRERLAGSAHPARPAGLGRLLVAAPADFPLDRAARTVAEVAGACDRDDARGAASAADSLLGLGPGLTPSGDDFVGGVLFARCALGPSAAWARAGSAVVARARARTHPISAALLSDLATGEGPEPLHDLIDALARRATGAAWGAVERLGRHGASSGWDMLAGVLVGLAGTGALPPRRS
jgi:hypothetical protein